jgi:uncharacterized OB-fold protein
MTALAAQTAGIPLPEPIAESVPFWEGCQRGELLYQRCRECGAAIHDPAGACRVCLSPDLDWVRSEGKGTVYSWTVIWRPQTPAFEVPYAVAIVDMAEGYQMLTSLIDCDTDDIRLGLPVEVAFRRLSDEITLPYFRPSGSA